jgi:predicted amidohydrolase YtcJ
VGKYAELSVLSHDYLTVAEQMIRKIESVMMLVGGRIAHARACFTGL